MTLKKPHPDTVKTAVIHAAGGEEGVGRYRTIGATKKDPHIK